MKKILVVSVIFLFIGVAVAPSINQIAVKASQDDDLVEVTTQACGIQGYGNTTVKLTREQANEIDLLFETINSKLNNVTSREESIHIYQNAIIELDKYDLLPQAMTSEQALHLTNGVNQNTIVRLLNNRQQEIFPKCVNVFCLLSLIATKSGWVYPILAPFGPLFVISAFLSEVFYTIGAGTLYNMLIPIILILSILNPLKLMNLVMIQGYYTDLHSIGIKGNVESDDVFLLVGFTGLMIFTLEKKVYFLGSALAIVPTA